MRNNKSRSRSLDLQAERPPSIVPPLFSPELVVDGITWKVRRLETDVVVIRKGEETDRVVIIDGPHRTVLIGSGAGWADIGRAVECVELITRKIRTHEGTPVTID